MKFNRTTIFLVILALGLGTFIYFAEIKTNSTTKINGNQNKVEKENKIFSFNTDEIKTLTIESKGQKITFEKTEAEIKPWLMIIPEKTKASDAAISFLVNLFNQATNKQKIPVTENQLKEYGLEQPQGKIWLILKNGDQYQINLGKANFDNSQLYAQILFPKSQTQEQEIFLVSKSFLYGIERDFEEWKEEEDTSSTTD